MTMFPAELFRFPLNVICCILWIAAVYGLYANCKKTMLVRFMLSPMATYISIALMLVLCAAVGLTGRREFTGSWLFVTGIFFFQTVLLHVILRGSRASTATGSRIGPVRWRFILLHVGLLTALGAGFWGAPDKQVLRMKAEMDKPCNEVWDINGIPSRLPYDITLESFVIRKYPDGTPEFFEAGLIIDDDPVSLTVNHPHERSWGEDIYLSSYDSNTGNNTRYCIIQIVKDPWKYAKVIGIIMLLAGVFLLFINGPDRSVRCDD